MTEQISIPKETFEDFIAWIVIIAFILLFTSLLGLCGYGKVLTIINEISALILILVARKMADWLSKDDRRKT